jgi:hypothetical protein
VPSTARGRRRNGAEHSNASHPSALSSSSLRRWAFPAQQRSALGARCVVGLPELRPHRPPDTCASTTALWVKTSTACERERVIGNALSGAEHNPDPENDPARRRPMTADGQQLLAFRIGNHELGSRRAYQSMRAASRIRSPCAAEQEGRSRVEEIADVIQGHDDHHETSEDVHRR